MPVMPYCTFSHVRAICNTDITNAEITEMIEETDELMRLRIDVASLSNTILRVISRTWTAYRCMLKDPNAQGLGEYSEDRAQTLKMLKDELDAYMMAASEGMTFKYGYADLRWPIV